MAFTKIASQADLPPPNQARTAACNGKMLCLANVRGTIAALDNECLHQGGSLGQGTIEDGKVVCPWHGWKWDPTTGIAVDHRDQKLRTYPVKLENGEVYVDV
jgi:nitrite reductase (NADH) small subunit